MSQENPVATVSTWIINFEEQEDRLRVELEQLEERTQLVQENLHATREWLDRLRVILSELRNLTPGSLDLFLKEPERITKNEIGTHFERIKAFLKSQHDPQTIAEIEFATGIPRTSISAVLYRTHKDEFSFHDLEGKRGKAWRLRSDNVDDFLPPPGAEKDIPF